MSQKEIVAFDLDLVLFPWKEMVAESLNVRYGCNLSTKDFNGYGIFPWLKKSNPEIHAKLQTEGRMEHFMWLSKNTNLLVSTPPYLGVKEVLSKIKQSGRKIAIITFRGTEENPDIFYQDGLKSTLKWFEIFQIPFDYIKFTGKKEEGLKQIEQESGEKIILYVEDHPLHVVPVVEAGYNLVLIDHGHNQDDLIHDLGDFPEYNEINFKQKWQKVLSSGKVKRIKNVTEIEKILNL